MKKTHKSNQALAVLLAIVFVCSCFVTITHANAEENTSGSLVVVSLGDSYSSGEGIEPFYGQNKSLEDKVKDEDWLAHRSTKGWPALLQFSGIAGFSGDYNVKYTSSSVLNWYFAAASGATTEHISKKNQTKTYNKSRSSTPITPFNLAGSVELPRQIDVFNGIEGTVDYVTMTIGGNDVKFVDIITTCALFSSYLHFGKTSKLQEDIDKIWGEFDKTRDNIEQVYRDVFEKAGPNAWIIVAGYPKLLDKDGRGGLINKAEAKLVNDNVVRFNNEIRSIVEKCSRNGMNIVFADVIEEFDKDGGHQAYSKEPWINKIMFFANSEDLDDASIASSYSVHPNVLGAQAYARCVNSKIKEIEAKKTVGTLRGILNEAYNPDLPIENAVLTVHKGEYSFRYNVKGGQICLPLPAGDYSIEISAGNYKEHTSNVTIMDGAATELNIGLELNVVPVAISQFNGNEYAVYDVPMTWSRAESFCESLGGHLVCISSKAENDFVLSLIAGGSKNLYWLGGSCTNGFTEWNWVTGESAGYFNWGKDKPDNCDSVEDKLQMYRNSINNNPIGSWNDASDYGAGYHSEFYELENTGFVCEWGLSSTYPADGTYYGSLDWSLNNYFRDGRDHVCLDIDIQIDNPEQILTNSISSLYVESKYILDEYEPVPASWSIDNVSVVEEDGSIVVYGTNHYTGEVETFIWDENRFYSSMNVDLPFAKDAIVIDEAFCIDYLYDYSLSPNTLTWDELGEYYLTYECYSGGWVTVTIENGTVILLKFEYSP